MSRLRWNLVGAAMVLMGIAGWLLVRPRPAVPQNPLWLEEVPRTAGIEFQHTDGSSGRRYIVEPMSAGLALFDYDGDGYIDIYFLNGAPLEGAKFDRPPTNALYRNLGDWKFQDVTELSGTGDRGFGLGVTVADYDSDGDPDLYLNNHGPNALYRNNGDGTFTDVTREAGVGNGDVVGAGTSFLDMDGDGDLDLYAANYLVFSYDIHVERKIDGIPSYPSPRDYVPVPDSLFRNDGDGTFTDVSRESGVGLHAGTGMGMVCCDCDDDGDTDVYVLNDVAENFFFMNDGHGVFEEFAMLNGTAYNYFGEENASMGVDCGDFDNDGRLDLFATSYQNEMPVLYRNTGSGGFEDVTISTGAGSSTYVYVNWGTGLVDFDNDGDRDIYIANGHTEDNVELRDTHSAYRAINSLLENDGQGMLADVTPQSGGGMQLIRASRGAAFDDLDNNGSVDVIVLNSRQAPDLLRSRPPADRHWIEIRLRGATSNRDAIGSRVRLTANGRTQVAEIHSGRSYQSHYGSRLHFGLGQADRVDRLEIHWHNGDVEVLNDIATRQILTIVQGQGQGLRTSFSPD